MSAAVLVTGGAGFIGKHVVRRLLQSGRRVRILDNFDPQVHGDSREAPDGADLLVGDVSDPGVWDAALGGVSAVIHLAAAVGVGQSMYEIAHYCNSNVMGTARLLEAVLARRKTLRKLVVASSMSIYGEGAYQCPACQRFLNLERTPADVARGRWEPVCPECETELVPVATTEDKPLRTRSVYAVNKRDQEEMCLAVGRALGLPTVALRFFNVYGPGQSLGNPYTGVAAIFASRLLAGAPALIFEDGRQSRDFIHVSDIARATLAALDRPVADLALNVGTGRSVSIRQLESMLRERLAGPPPEFTGVYRAGDIRHCFADVSAAQVHLGWKSSVQLEQGIDDLIAWVRTQRGYGDRLEKAHDELRSHGMLKRVEDHAEVKGGGAVAP
jgi:dTDP-L-rhamnose 4-epimerase